MLRRYFTLQLSESKIRENFALVYQIFTEMLDGGFMLTMEPNQLHDMIPPPTMLDSVSKFATGRAAVSDILSAASTSKIPWRRKNVKYLNNSIKMDFVEKLHVVVGSSGK
eukprot:UN28261